MKTTFLKSLLALAAVTFGYGLLAGSVFENGVLTFDVAEGVSESRDAAFPEGVSKIVKTGPGTLVVSAANATFKGAVEIRNGILEITHKDALGSGNTIEVFSGEDGSGQYRVTLHQKAENGNTGDVQGNVVKIAGAGPDGKGAVYLGGTGRVDAFLGKVVLAGDATIGQWAGGYRGIKGVLDLGGHTLTIEGSSYFVLCDNLHVLNMKHIVSNCSVLHSGTVTYENCDENAVWTKSKVLTVYDTPGKLPWSLVQNGGVIYGSVDADVYNGSAIGNVFERPVTLNADLTIGYDYKAYGFVEFAGNVLGDAFKISTGDSKKLMRIVFSGEENAIDTLTVGSTNYTIDVDGRLDAKTAKVDSGTLKIANGGHLYASAAQNSVYTIGNSKNGNSVKSAEMVVVAGALVDFAPQASGNVTASIRMGDTGSKPAFLEVQEGAVVSNNIFGAYDAGSKSAFHNSGTVYSTAYGGGNDGTFASKGSGFFGLYGGEFKYRTTLALSTKPTATGVVHQTGGKYLNISGTTWGFNGCSDYRLSGGLLRSDGTVVMCDYSYNHSDADRETPGGSATLTLYGENCPTAEIYSVNMCNRSNYFVSTINLNAGVFCTHNLGSNGTDFSEPVGPESPRSYLNFNGGTWAAWGEESGHFFGSNLPNAVTIFERGIVFDTSRSGQNEVKLCAGQYNATLKFKRPSGRGVKSIKLPADFDRNGFLGTMPVTITGGGGEGATAILEYDPKTRTAEEVIVTCQGWDYVEAPRVTVKGADFATEYECEVELTEDNRPMGPIVKTGSADLNFNATNFAFNGTFVVSNGVLRILKYTHLSDDVCVKVAGGSFSYDWTDRTFKEVGGHGEIYGYRGESFRKLTVTDALRFDAEDAMAGRKLEFTCGTLALGENAKVVIDNASSLTDGYDVLDLMTLTDKTFPRIPECTGLSDGWRLRVVDAGKTLRLYRNRRMHLIIR